MPSLEHVNDGMPGHPMHEIPGSDGQRYFEAAQGEDAHRGETKQFDRVPGQAIVNKYRPGQKIALDADRE